MSLILHPARSATAPHASLSAHASPRFPARLHRSELAVVALSSLNLCFLPWAFGGVDPWSEIVGLGLAVAAAVAALLPRRPEHLSAHNTGWRRQIWPRLRSFPVFWAGLALFAYLTAQACNPAFEHKFDDTTWWLVRLDHLRWMPAGMKVPFDEMNTWRTLVVWGSCWLIVCALWVGITRRRSILWILTALTANAAAFAGFGIVQRAAGVTRVYSVRPVQNAHFVAALIYENHASAFFSLLACIAIGIVLHKFRRAGSDQDRSGSIGIFMLSAVLSIVGLMLSCSFAGIALFGAALLVIALVWFWCNARTAFRSDDALPVLIIVALLLLATTALLVSVGYRDLQKRIASTTADGAMDELKIRLLVDARGWEMFTDRWLFGWGAGDFRYGFTKYQHREAALSLRGDKRLRWEHAHDDWLEYLVELGVAGIVPIVFMAAYWLREIFRVRLWRSPARLAILCGLVALAIHALFDFPLQNPAILITACALLPLIVRWAEIEPPDDPRCRRSGIHGVDTPNPWGPNAC
jgi:hypothetical protein